MNHYRLIAFLILLLISIRLPAETLTGRIVGVSDGDTLTLIDAEHIPHKIRLSGIDTPEKRQPFGEKAKTAFPRSRTTERPRPNAGKLTAIGAAFALFLSTDGMLAWNKSRVDWHGGIGSTPRNRRDRNVPTTNTPSYWPNYIASGCGRARIRYRRGNGGAMGGYAENLMK